MSSLSPSDDGSDFSAAVREDVKWTPSFSCPMSIMDELRDQHAAMKRKFDHGLFDKGMKIWNSLPPRLRVQCIKNVSPHGQALRHPEDTLMGDVRLIMPEMNLRELSMKPDHFATIYRHRLENSLSSQYLKGIHGGLGDRDFILKMICTKGLMPTKCRPESHALFFDDESYGMCLDLSSDKPDISERLQRLIKADLCIARNVGELIVKRQVFTMTCMNIILDMTLQMSGETTNLGSPTTGHSSQDDSAVASLYRIRQRPTEGLSIPHVLASARDTRDVLMSYVELLACEPSVLANAVNIHSFFSTPDPLADAQGRQIPGYLDRHISAAAFDAVQSAVKAVATWDYLCRLLELLGRQPHGRGRDHQAVIMREISHVCHLEYCRTQTLMGRSAQAGAGTQRFFKRIAKALDNNASGGAGIGLNPPVDPECLSIKPVIVHAQKATRLWEPRAQAALAADWVKRLVSLRESYPVGDDDDDDDGTQATRELEVLGDLIDIAGYMRNLTPANSPWESMSPSREQAWAFVSRAGDLDSRLRLLKSRIDLAMFTVPIDTLLEPGMTEGAVAEICRLVRQETGSDMAALYHETIDNSLAGLDSMHRRSRSSISSMVSKVEHARLSPSSQASRESATTSASSPPPRPRFRVSSRTANLFSILFSKSAEKRGSILWAHFVNAMVELGFTVIPRYGSVVSFTPSGAAQSPSGLAQSPNSIQLHRPGRSSIEGRMMKTVADQLREAYGWDRTTFFSTES